MVILFFFLLRRLLPRSTLFPYTTLFRSYPNGVCILNYPLLNEKMQQLDRDQQQPTNNLLYTGNVTEERGALIQDRKSTRLNSSHVAISYAVFCLKKKNNRRRKRFSDNT